MTAVLVVDLPKTPTGVAIGIGCPVDVLFPCASSFARYDRLGDRPCPAHFQAIQGPSDLLLDSCWWSLALSGFGWVTPKLFEVLWDIVWARICVCHVRHKNICGSDTQDARKRHKYQNEARGGCQDPKAIPAQKPSPY